MHILINALAVFALTLLVTKSKILAGKREFVEERYESSKVGEQQPGWIHRCWHAVWTHLLHKADFLIACIAL